MKHRLAPSYPTPGWLAWLETIRREGGPLKGTAR